MQTLADHIATEHKISPLQTYLKEIVYGGTDGIITTFAVVAGFTGAQAGVSLPGISVLTVLLFGLANLFADGVSMGLGSFLSLRSEKDLYKKEQAKELFEIRHHPETEKTETIEILKAKGFTHNQSEELAAIYATNESYWLHFMMNDELEMPNPTRENPYFTALATLSAFIVFGTIPLLPYLLGGTSQVFFTACLATLIALFALGILRWRVTNEHILRSVFEIVLLGSVSASIAYFVGTFFRL